MADWSYYKAGPSDAPPPSLIRFRTDHAPVVGDRSLAARVLGCLQQPAHHRLAVALDLHKVLWEVVEDTLEPVYNVYEGGQASDFFLDMIAVEYLPNFTQPYRLLAFSHPSDGNPLRLLEVRYVRDPKFGPINPDAFPAHYQVPVADGHVPFRAAVIDLLKRRGVDRSTFFLHDNE